GRAASVDRFGRYQVELRAQPIGRRARGLREGVAGQPDRDEKPDCTRRKRKSQQHQTSRVGNAALVVDPEFHFWVSWLRGNRPYPSHSRSRLRTARRKSLPFQPPVWKNPTMPLATATMLMHSIPKANWMPHAVGDPLLRPLTMARQVMIAQKTQAAPNAWKKCWNSVTTFTTLAAGVEPNVLLLAIGGVVGA